MQATGSNLRRTIKKPQNGIKHAEKNETNSRRDYYKLHRISIYYDILNNFIAPTPTSPYTTKKSAFYRFRSSTFSIYFLFPSSNGLQGSIKWKKLNSQPVLEILLEERQAYTVYCIFKTFYWQHDCEYQGYWRWNSFSFYGACEKLRWVCVPLQRSWPRNIF